MDRMIQRAINVNTVDYMSKVELLMKLLMKLLMTEKSDDIRIIKSI